jgi:hypothetical protein
MRRGGKKEGRGDSGSGKDAAKERRPPAKWVPVALEDEFPSEFSHTALLATLLFVGVLSVYAATMHPSVSGGDNGELLGCACELGIAHPPGYPTFTMLGFLFFKFFPFGRPAFRIGFMSAMCDAMAGVLVMLCVQRWVLLHEVSARRDRRKKGRDSSERAASVQDNDSAKEAKEESDVFIGSAWLGLLGGGLYSLSPLVWMYSVQAEVFAMNNMFAALLLYLIIRYNEQRSPQLAYLGALCIGLGLTNQHTLVLYAVPVVVWALLQDKCALCAPRHFGVMVALGLLGLTPYIFLYTHVNYAPLGSWGNTGTLDGFITHFTRKEYGTFQLYSGGDAQQKQVLKGTLLYLNAMTEDCLLVGLPLMLAGMVYAVSERLRCRRETPITPILCAWVFYLIVFHSLSNLPIDKLRLFLGIHMRFWMQPHLISFMLVALGFKAVLSHPMVLGGQLWQRHLVVPLVLSLLLAQVGLNYKKMDQSDNTHVAELGKKCLQYMPKNSIIISQGDMVTNAMRYLQRCEKYRTDVLLLDETMMTYKWMRDVQGVKMQPWGIVFPSHYHAPPSYTHIPDTYSMEQFLAANAKNFKKHPLFKAGAWLGDVQGLADSGVPSWHLVPVGLISKVMRKGKDMSADDWLKWYNKKLFPAEPDYYRFDDAAWEWLMRRIVLEWRAKVAFRFANIAVEKAKETGDISWIKNGTADLEDILRLEMLPEGGKDKSYILADLYNAIGMMTVHMQVPLFQASLRYTQARMRARAHTHTHSPHRTCVGPKASWRSTSRWPPPCDASRCPYLRTKLWRRCAQPRTCGRARAGLDRRRGGAGGHERACRLQLR